MVVYDNSSWTDKWYTLAHADLYPFNAVFNLNYTDFDQNDPRVFQISGTGDGFITGSLYQASDKRLKENILPLKGALNKIMQVNGFTYNWKLKTKSTDMQIGFLAQELEKVFPQLVKTDEKGYKSVAYSNMVPVLVEGIKEQQKQIGDQNKKIEELEKMVEQLMKASH